MSGKPPEELWKALEAQADEDDAFDAHVKAAAAMTDDQLDAELRAHGVDPDEAAAVAREMAESAPAERAAAAVAQTARDDDRGARDRAPRKRLPVVVWLAAAAAVAVAGGLVYAALRTPPPAPPVPEPTPSTSPSIAPPPVDLVAQAAELRDKARQALAAGRADECLALLGEAAAKDPAGDATPAVKAMRDKAIALQKPPR